MATARGWQTSAKAVGGEALAAKVYELPAGESVCPYHYEYEEEWLLVLDGTVIVRTPEGEEELARGDMVCFPPGPAGAHKATNRGEVVARIVMFSSARRAGGRRLSRQQQDRGLAG